MALLTSIAVASALAAKAPPPHVAYETFVHARTRYHVITCDLSSGALIPKTLMASGSRPVWSLIAREQPIAAITGTFFAPKGGVPVADVLVDGNLKAKGDRGSVLAVDHFGGVSIFDERYKQSVDWAMYRYGLRGGVRVVSNGKVQPNPKAQRFRDRRIWGHAARTGVGITKNRKLVLIATSRKVTLSDLGRAMVAKGVRDGLSLDGGGSTCLYFNGKMVIRPQRKLVNLFVINSGSPSSLPAVRIADSKQLPAKIANIAPIEGEAPALPAKSNGPSGP